MKEEYESRIKILRTTIVDIGRILIRAENEERLANISYDDLTQMSELLESAISNELKYGMPTPNLELVCKD